jgi:hypothetical protein
MTPQHDPESGYRFSGLREAPARAFVFRFMIRRAKAGRKRNMLQERLSEMTVQPKNVLLGA